jgi:phosphatidylserine/phosphatidylglycerophosphate/cardiolipin synthase-like enzyme
VEQIHQQIQDYEAEKESLQASLNVLPEAEQPTKDIVTGKTKRIEELETEVQKLRALSERDKPVRGNEHRQILKDALTSAQQIVMIISPWIRQDSVDREISGLIQKAIERGVIILIGYGMPLRSRESKEDYLDESVAKAFEKIKKGPNGNKLKVEWLGNTHEKILVCDRSFCVVTSFNWLSYRGDKGFRKEMGTYFENPKMVQEVTDDVLKRFKSAPTNS